MKKLSVRDILVYTTGELSSAAIPDPDPQKTAAHLLSYVTGLSMSELLTTDDNDPVPSDIVEELQVLLERRKAGEPLQYILGEWDFYGRRFILNRDVFIPRPETEFIIDAAKKQFRPDIGINILDIGTGSGAIAVTLACELPLSNVLATDISYSALCVAKENAKFHGVSERIAFLCGECLAPLRLTPQFDLVCTNPPYVPENQFKGLQREITNWEPQAAFLGGSDGLDFLRRMLFGDGSSGGMHFPITEFIKPGRLFITEIGWSQKNAVIDLINKSGGMRLVEVVEDYNGIPRTLVCEKCTRE